MTTTQNNRSRARARARHTLQVNSLLISYSLMKGKKKQIMFQYLNTIDFSGRYKKTNPNLTGDVMTTQNYFVLHTCSTSDKILNECGKGRKTKKKTIDKAYKIRWSMNEPYESNFHFRHFIEFLCLLHGT